MLQQNDAKQNGVIQGPDVLRPGGITIPIANKCTMKN